MHGLRHGDIRGNQLTVAGNVDLDLRLVAELSGNSHGHVTLTLIPLVRATSAGAKVLELLTNTDGLRREHSFFVSSQRFLGKNALKLHRPRLRLNVIAGPCRGVGVVAIGNGAVIERLVNGKFTLREATGGRKRFGGSSVAKPEFAGAEGNYCRFG